MMAAKALVLFSLLFVAAAQDCKEGSCVEEKDAAALLQSEVKIRKPVDDDVSSSPEELLEQEEQEDQEASEAHKEEGELDGEWGFHLRRRRTKSSSYTSPSYAPFYTCTHRNSNYAGIPNLGGRALEEEEEKEEKIFPSGGSLPGSTGSYSPTMGSGSTGSVCIDPMNPERGWCSDCEEAHGADCNQKVADGEFATQNECFKELMCNHGTQIAQSWKDQHCSGFPNAVAGCTTSLLESNESQTTMERKTEEEARSLDDSVSGKRCA